MSAPKTAILCRICRRQPTILSTDGALGWCARCSAWSTADGSAPVFPARPPQQPAGKAKKAKKRKDDQVQTSAPTKRPRDRRPQQQKATKRQRTA